MNLSVTQRLHELQTTPQALERTRIYLRGQLENILQTNEDILVCFPNDGPASMGGVLETVIQECGCRPVFWGPDFRWKGLLRQAFDSNAHAIIGPPLVVLGLMKMSRLTATPLNIHIAVTAGYPYISWLTESIKEGLDCKLWGSYMIGEGPVIAGFSCTKEAGIHIREELFEASVRTASGEVMEDAQRGHLSLRYKEEPDLVFDTEETAKIWHQPCSCGCDDARIVETIYVGADDPDKAILENRFLTWTSVLDYRVTETASGPLLELVVFPGKLLPQIDFEANLSIREWDPETDAPFCMEIYRKTG